MRFTLPLFFALVLFSPSLAADERLSPELLWKLGRVGGGALSPDGHEVAYTVRRYDLAENKGRSELHVVRIDSGSDRSILEADSISGAQWAETPTGLRLFFSGSADDVKGQVWSCDPDGGELVQVTDIEGGVGNLKVSPTGTHVAFTRDVKLDPTVNELYADLPKADARIIDDLMFRHWDAWHDYAYSHVHVAEIGDDGRASDAIDLMEGLRVDCPLPPFGGAEHFTWSPDGREIALTAKLVADWAESTDSSIFVVPADGKGRLRSITTGQPGYDTEPVYSPDGRFLAYHSMERASFESDRNRILVYNRASGRTVDATAGLDQTAHGATWSPDSQHIYFASEHRGTNQVFRVRLGETGATQVTEGRYNWSLKALRAHGGDLILGRMSMQRPTELFVVPGDGGDTRALTHVNDEIFERLELPEIRERWVRASDGQQIHNWVILPPGFEQERKRDPKKKWPVLTYCQGGPQGQIGQWFSYRWNFHLMAAQGYVVLAVNRRGLPGFGREWNDQISGDWGGQAMQDILSATDDLLTEPWTDARRVAAIGASFGGYTVYWLMGNAASRFQCMIAHCGVFNLESMYGSTEELFFVNWDLGGPYWKSDALQAEYTRFSPHRFVRNWQTPLLVIHGQKDFRVPVTQGIEAFTAAQVEGVPSRFLYFPEEGHWVLSPQNGVLWHRVFFDWLGRWCGPESRKTPDSGKKAAQEATS